MDRLPSPSKLMRVRRPERYSDSERVDAYRLSESELRNHLDTLTDRNQHKDFENFCRKLCERELAPNLRPQTGPEGGGDGKVDTETYPVALDIAERWYAAPGDILFSCEVIYKHIGNLWRRNTNYQRYTLGS
ncbi:hypothetical protein [Agrobacterium larrymoorei]|uniref:hypothetical protein n=1 Tax=Agrobacterium larrymoorei TaxID=160699 RepID=UPI0030C44CB1